MTSTTLRLSSGRIVGLRRAGQGARHAGAPLVLLHGVGLNAAVWQPQLDVLSAHNSVIAIDLPGHGASDGLPVGSTLVDYVGWCAEVLQELGPVRLAGHSMGALIAGGVAVRHPDLVRGVALLNGVYRRSPAARAAVEARAALNRAGDIDFDAPLVRWFGTTRSAARDRTAQLLRAVDPLGYATAYTAFATGDATFADELRHIDMPFLALTGAQDANSTPAMSRAMAACVPGGRAEVIAGHGHMMPLTAPEAVCAHLLTWLKATAKTTVPQ